MTVYPGLEEDLAEAIDKDFYDSYKNWTLNNRHAETSQKVNIQNQSNYYIVPYSDSPLGKELGKSSQ